MQPIIDGVSTLLQLLLEIITRVLFPPEGLSAVSVLIWFGIVMGLVPVTWHTIMPARLARTPHARLDRRHPRTHRRMLEPERAVVARRHVKAQQQTERATAAQARRQAKAQQQAERAAAAEARRQAKAQQQAERAAAAEARRIAAEQKQAARAAAAAARQQAKAQQQAERAAAAEARRIATEQKQAARAAAAEARPKRAKVKPPKNLTTAYGTDPNRIYSFRYRVVSLADLITSNTETGGINPAYDPALQPRQRDRIASRSQIEQIAKNLVPASVLADFHQLDRGAPVVGADLMVESGNGRVLGLRRAAEVAPERWTAYQQELRSRVKSYGISAAELDGIADPVLVRERITEVDRASFAREANEATVLQMSSLEHARVDSRRISDEMIFRFHVREEQTIDQALRARSNTGFIRDFVGTLPENERAALLRKNGTISQMGIWRIKAALFVRAFSGEAGNRLADTFLEAVDSTTKNFETALSATLPQLVRVEALISAGHRDAALSIGEDLSKSLDMLARLRENDIEVWKYLDQASMFERELTPIQEQLLMHFDEIGRSPKRIREFLSEYATAVESAPDTRQTDLFGVPVVIRKDDIIERLISSSQQRKAA